MLKLENKYLPVVFFLILLKFFFHILSFLLVVMLLFGSLQIHCVLLLQGIRVARSIFLNARSSLNVSRIIEPNVSIFILQELCFHLQNLILIHLLYVVRQFVALLNSKMFIVLLGARFKELNIIRHTFVVFMIIDFFCYLPLSLFWVSFFIVAYRSIELNINWFPNSFGFNACLYAVKSQPFGIIWSTTEFVNKLCILYDSNMLIVVFESSLNRIRL